MQASVHESLIYTLEASVMAQLYHSLKFVWLLCVEGIKVRKVQHKGQLCDTEEAMS